MTARQIVGMVLVALGMVSLLWGGISWTHDETVPLLPLLGGGVLSAGAILLLLPATRRITS